jgi:hypothetical protein
MFILWNRTQERDGEHFLNIFDRHHRVSLNHAGSNPIDQQLDVVDVIRFKQACDSIGISNGGYFGRRNDDRLLADEMAVINPTSIPAGQSRRIKWYPSAAIDSTIFCMFFESRYIVGDF